MNTAIITVTAIGIAISIGLIARLVIRQSIAKREVFASLFGEGNEAPEAEADRREFRKTLGEWE